MLIQVGEITYFGKKTGEFARVEPLLAECTPELDKEQEAFLQSAVDMFVDDLTSYCAKKSSHKQIIKPTNKNAPRLYERLKTNKRN